MARFAPRIRWVKPRVPRIAWPIAGLALGIAAAVVAVFAWQAEQGSQQRETAARESIPAAEAAARAIFSYDHKGWDAAVNNGKSFTTGDFTKEYEQTTSALKPAVMSEQAVVRAEVSAAGVITASGEQTEVLLYVNQYRQNLNIQGEKMDQNRIVLVMVRTAEGWKVQSASAI